MRRDENVRDLQRQLQEHGRTRAALHGLRSEAKRQQQLDAL
jgi:hypothetical protein